MKVRFLLGLLVFIFAVQGQGAFSFENDLVGDYNYGSGTTKQGPVTFTEEEEMKLTGVKEDSQAGIILAKKIAPATATIEIFGRIRGRDGRASGVKYLGNGSCWFLAPDHAYTNFHVVKEYAAYIKWCIERKMNPSDYRTIRVNYTDPVTGEEIIYNNIEVVAFIEERGLDSALIKIKGGNFPYLKLGDSDGLQSMQRLFTVASPVGLKKSAMWLWIANIHPSSFDDPIVDKWIELQGAIHPGASGSPAVNLSGEVVGMINVAPERVGAGGMGQTIAGLGLMIPVNNLRELPNKFIPGFKNGKFIR